MNKEYIEYWDFTNIKKVLHIKGKEIRFKDINGFIWAGKIIKIFKNVGYDIYIY